MFVFSRSFYLLLNEKVFFIQYKCCIDTRFSKCSSQEFAGFTVCEKFPSLLYHLSLSILSIHRSIWSCDRKFVFRFWCRGRRCHRYKEKNFQKPNLCFGGLRNFPKKSSPRQIIFISIIAFKRYVAHFLKLNYSRFNSAQSQNSHGNRAFLFPFSRKKSFTIFA